MKKGKHINNLGEFTHVHLDDSGGNPAALMAAARGDFANALIAATPGGIEAQERRGQQEQAVKETLPKTMQGCTKADFEKLGFKFFGETERIFWQCLFPTGWTKKPTSHSMWSNLLDDKGRKRGSIFFKAAFYDFDAHIGLNVRYSVNGVSLDEKKEEIFDRSTGEYKEGKHSARSAYTRYEVVDTATEKSLFALDPLPDANWDNREEGLRRSATKDEARDICSAWLTKNFPDWQKPLAYWD